MKSTWKKLLALACIACMVMAQLAACAPTAAPAEETAQATTEPAAEATAAEPAAEDVYAISGTVSIAYPEGEVAEIQPVLDAFRAQYPNVTVEEVPFAGSTGGAFNEFLTQRAAANDMPDVMWLDWNDFAPEVASGFVMPLNDLMAGDPDAEYVPAGMTDPYTYNGKLYALPCQMNAMGITINLDMLEALNLDKPSYDWTFAEFEDLLKKAISADSVGAATLEDLDQVYSAQAAGYMYPAYDAANQTFDFTNMWVPAMNKLAELRAIPGLEAWSMRFPKNEDGTTSMDSEYVAKFGEAGKDDNHYTFKNGMALLCTNATWNDNWMRSECKVTWDYWPYPRMDESTPVYTPIHVDCAYLTSTCAEPEVAFQLLKWLTYGVEGNLQRLDIFAARGDAQAAGDDTKLLKTWFIPCTQNPEVLAKFEENPHLTEGFKALYRSTANSIRGDLNKILPGYSAIFTDEVNALITSVRNGEASAADVGPQIDALVNPALAEQLAAFYEKVK